MIQFVILIESSENGEGVGLGVDIKDVEGSGSDLEKEVARRLDWLLGEGLKNEELRRVVMQGDSILDEGEVLGVSSKFAIERIVGRLRHVGDWVDGRRILAEELCGRSFDMIDDLPGWLNEKGDEEVAESAEKIIQLRKQEEKK